MIISTHPQGCSRVKKNPLLRCRWWKEAVWPSTHSEFCRGQSACPTLTPAQRRSVLSNHIPLQACQISQRPKPSSHLPRERDREGGFNNLVHDMIWRGLFSISCMKIACTLAALHFLERCLMSAAQHSALVDRDHAIYSALVQKMKRGRGFLLNNPL